MADSNPPDGWRIFFAFTCILNCHAQFGRYYTCTVKSTKAVLIVEDEAINRLFLVRVCERMGHKTIQAQNGQDALDKFAATEVPVGLIFMDLSMPVLDGIEATRRFRELGTKVPILALTAHSTDEDRRACLAAGMDDVLIKPVQIPQIQAAIERYIDRT